MKKHVHISIPEYLKDKKQEVPCEGRLLGLVDDRTFSLVRKYPDIARKVMTRETVSLDDVVATYKEIENNKGARIAIALIHLKGKSDEEYVKNYLYFTDRLARLSNYVTGQSANFTTTNSNWFHIKEK